MYIHPALQQLNVHNLHEHHPHILVIPTSLGFLAHGMKIPCIALVVLMDNKLLRTNVVLFCSVLKYADYSRNLLSADVRHKRIFIHIQEIRVVICPARLVLLRARECKIPLGTIHRRTVGIRDRSGAVDTS